MSSTLSAAQIATRLADYDRDIRHGLEDGSVLEYMKANRDEMVCIPFLFSFNRNKHVHRLLFLKIVQPLMTPR
jgi:hypothetical protein